MRPVLTPEESVALDRQSEARGVSVAALMDRAGAAVARAAVRVARGGYGRRAVVVCGRGNNGGDGFVAARYLARAGMGVRALLVGRDDELRGAAADSAARLALAGVRLEPFDAAGARRALSRADVAVDALFGTGFHGVADGPAGEAIRTLEESATPVVAVDVPSGVDAGTGLARGDAVRATATITLGALKPGLLFEPGASRAGTVEVADIGFPRDLVRSDVGVLEAADVRDALPHRAPDGHKRASGAVLVVAGSRSMTGAAVLVARAAYRAGAGLVMLAVPESILPVVENGITEATFLPLPDEGRGVLSEQAWPVLSKRFEGFTALAIGPGLTTSPATVAVLRSLVPACPVPFVLDADGLNAFAGRAQALADRASAAVLTPHPGEFARLTAVAAADLGEDRIGHVRKAAADLRCPVLLKGSRTIVADPDGHVAINATGGPFLATGGTGDVLTGTIAAMLARGVPAARAAGAGAFVHGVAGRLAAARLGEGTVAGDVVEHLPLAAEAIRRGDFG